MTMVRRKGLKFLQNNAHRSERVTKLLNRKLIEDGIDVMFIQEPQVNRRNEICDLPDGQVVFGNEDGRPRCGVWMNSRFVDGVTLGQFLSRDVAPVKITAWAGNSKIEVVICSAYFDINGEVPEKLVRLVEYWTEKNLDLLISCDANAHSKIWGCEDDNARGSMVLDFVLSNNLAILNKGSKPTYFRTGVRTIIDLTLATQRFERKITDWRVTDEASGSDHARIEFEWKGITVKKTEYRIPQKTNWNLYEKLLRLNLWTMRDLQIRSRADLDIYTQKFTDIITETYHSACPLLNKESNTDKKWYNKYLRKLRKEVNKRWNNAKKPEYKSLNRHNCQAWRDYYDLLTRYHDKLKRAKEKSFDDTCKKIDNLAAGSRLYKLMSKTHTNKLGTFKKSNNKYTDSEIESLKLLANTHFPNSVVLDDIQEEFEDEIHEVEDFDDDDLSSNIFTNDKLKWAIKSFKAFKSAGMDGIFPALVQKGMNLLLPFLKNIFINSHRLGYIPIIWRKVLVKFILKGGKMQTQDVKLHSC